MGNLAEDKTKRGSGHSFNMHDQTELPGQTFPSEVIDIISHRYHLAGELINEKRVLEVGAGSGIGLSYLSKRAAEIVAGEYSQENLSRLAKKEIANVSVVQLDAHDLSFEQDSFDTIIAMAMIYYLDAEKFFSEVVKVLKPDGKLFFCSSNKDVDGFVESPFTTAYYSVPEMAQLLAKYGFQVTVKGAFPTQYVGLTWKIRSIVKNIAKSILSLLPGGAKAWQKLRQSTVSEFRVLPDNVCEELEAEPGLRDLNPKEVNTDCRVLYYYATLPE